LHLTVFDVDLVQLGQFELVLLQGCRFVLFDARFLCLVSFFGVQETCLDVLNLLLRLLTDLLKLLTVAILHLLDTGTLLFCVKTKLALEIIRSLLDWRGFRVGKLGRLTSGWRVLHLETLIGIDCIALFDRVIKVIPTTRGIVAHHSLQWRWWDLYLRCLLRLLFLLLLGYSLGLLHLGNQSRPIVAPLVLIIAIIRVRLFAWGS
jgi:hypothetical protein